MAEKDHRIDEINLGEPTPPRAAASVILVRSGAKHGGDGLEVLLGQRTPKARFMPGVWVFPGGAVDGDASDEPAHRQTAVRELEEEVGVSIVNGDELVEFSRWITPVEVRTRFDTRFYLAKAPAHCAPEADGEEIVDVVWVSPAKALERHAADDLALVFPTIKQLETLREFESVEEAIEDARGREIEPILPRIVAESPDDVRVLLPGDPGY